MKKILIPFFTALIVLTGCQNKTLVVPTDAIGSLCLSVACAENDFNDKLLVKSSKAVQMTINTDLFTVELTKQFDEYGEPSNWNGKWILSEFPEVMELAPGQYKIVVKSPVSDRTSTLAPIYSGEQNFTIVEDKVTEIELICSIQNMKVTVAPTANFFTELRNYTISVTAEYEGVDTPVSVSWTDADFTMNTDGTYTTSKVGYFEAVPLSVMVTGLRTLDGSDASLKEPVVVKDVAPRDNHILNIDVQVTGETKTTMIMVDSSLNDPKDSEVFVPGFEEIPIPDEDEEEDNGGSESKETTLVWEANPDFAPVNLMVDGDNVVVDPQVKVVVNCPRKISSFVIKVSDNFKSAIALLTTDSVDYLDLVNDQKLIEFFVDEMYLPTGTNLSGKTQVEFDLSGLAQMVPMIASADKEETVFTLEIEDSLGNPFVKEIKFITSNPASAE